MKPKKLVKIIRKKLDEYNFQRQEYEMSKTALELKTFNYIKNDYEIFIHRYHNSVRFYTRNMLNKEESFFEIWSSKYKVERNFSKSGLIDLFDEVVDICIKHTNKI